ncbi:hypothetical protein C8R44DRAFT_715833 [Mycena epipterygia]|nr:hypothetical protein C8R44DRAFT_715833 [Mycena epipterygia]
MPSYKVNAALTLLSMLLIRATADVVGWSGNNCNGDEGLDVACDGTCFDFTGRHSIETIVSGSHCVAVFEDGFCGEEVAVFLNQGGGSCVTVSTGTTVNSFQCFAGNTCAVDVESNTVGNKSATH